MRKVARQQRLIGQSGEAILGRRARHGDRSLSQGFKTVAVHVVGRNHRLPLSDQHPQADIVALGALRFFNCPVAHVDRKRDAAHRDGVGGVGASAFGGGDQAFGEIGECGLIEKRSHLQMNSIAAGERGRADAGKMWARAV